MKTIPIDEAVPSFRALIGEVKRGEEIVLTEHARVVARMLPPVSEADRAAWTRDMKALFAKMRAAQAREPTEEEIRDEIAAHRRGKPG